MSNGESLKLRRAVAIDELMLCRAQLRHRATEAITLSTEIDSVVNSNLRRVGIAEPESIVAELEAMAVKAGAALDVASL